MPTEDIQIAQLIWQTRRLFQRLASESNDLLTVYNITASQRAVLEFLDRDEPETLANIARAHDVSRQHIQQTFNDLQDKKLVETQENPEHKRSFLVKRTVKGKELFLKIKKSESKLIAEIAKSFNSKAVQTTVETLTEMNSLLHSEEWLEIKLKQVNKEK